MMPTLLTGDYFFVSKFAYGYSRHSFPFSLPLFEGRILGELPERGDVVMFKVPWDNLTDFTKRIIGLPGDRTQVWDGVLYINGDPVKRERIEDWQDDEGTSSPFGSVARYLETLPNGGPTYEVLELVSNGSVDNTRVYEVPPGHVFVLGDNRDNSLDSRMDRPGFIPLENLVGKAEFFFFSSQRGSLFSIDGWLSLRSDRLFMDVR